jgi:hypothetical protein
MVASSTSNESFVRPIIGEGSMGMVGGVPAGYARGSPDHATQGGALHGGGIRCRVFGGRESPAG